MLFRVPIHEGVGATRFQVDWRLLDETEHFDPQLLQYDWHGWLADDLDDWALKRPDSIRPWSKQQPDQSLPGETWPPKPRLYHPSRIHSKILVGVHLWWCFWRWGNWVWNHDAQCNHNAHSASNVQPQHNRCQPKDEILIGSEGDRLQNVQICANASKVDQEYPRSFRSSRH